MKVAIGTMDMMGEKKVTEGEKKIKNKTRNKYCFVGKNTKIIWNFSFESRITITCMLHTFQFTKINHSKNWMVRGMRKKNNNCRPINLMKFNFKLIIAKMFYLFSTYFLFILVPYPRTIVTVSACP